MFRLRRFSGLTHRIGLLALVAVAPILNGACSEVAGDEFELFNGGRIEGEHIETKMIDGKEHHVFKSTAGAVVTLSVEQISGKVKKSEAEIWYEAWLPNTQDTVEGHLAMSRECKKRELDFQRDHHLLQVIQIDPENEEARRALGFGQINGKWVRVDIFRRQNGYIRSAGRWHVPQDLAIEREKDEFKAKQVEWHQEISRLRRIITKNSDSGEAMAKLRSIRDPFAIKPLTDMAQEDKSPALRRVAMRILAEIGTPPALSPLVKLVLVEPHLELQRYAEELIGDTKSDWAAQALRAGLTSSNNVIVRRAARALARIKSPAVVPDLIEALFTKHKVVTGSDSNYNLGFGGNGGSNLNAGQGKKVFERTFRNVEVRDALIAITDMNYQYDEARWATWYEATQTPQVASLRRSP
jgi:hypothetical protein